MVYISLMRCEETNPIFNRFTELSDPLWYIDIVQIPVIRTSIETIDRSVIVISFNVQGKDYDRLHYE